VVAYQAGKQVAVDEAKTAGPPTRIVLQPDRSTFKADGDDLSFVTVRIEDKDGNLFPMADNLVRFKLEGPAKIAAVDNGNAASEESFQADYRRAFNGLALVIVRGDPTKAGTIKLTATSDGLKSDTKTLSTTR
jgi:beta-galactosidase